MSNANSEVKVLTVALKRVRAGRWGQGTWLGKGPNAVTGVPAHLLCLEGSITGGSQIPKTEAQTAALNTLRVVMSDWHDQVSIPGGNDHNRFVHQMAIDILEEALRRAKGQKADTARRTGPDMAELFKADADASNEALEFEDLVAATAAPQMACDDLVTS